VQTARVLAVDGLVKRYGATLALDGVSFAVEPGQVFGFVGRNGAGKTTTMRIVLGVLAADAGAVRWQGRPVDADVRRRTGYMPEERGLYPKMRVRDQLSYLAELHGASRRDARAATDHWVERLGLSDRSRDRVETLSLGNQQRVQLAAALVHAPDLLVLDEPFSGSTRSASTCSPRRSRSGCGRTASPSSSPATSSTSSSGSATRSASSPPGAWRRSGAWPSCGRAARSAACACARTPSPTGGPVSCPACAPSGGRTARSCSSSTTPPTTRPSCTPALARGRVQEFTPVRPTLTELFREVVTP
jgi:ABC-2 type transport system ATP-binding protein